MPKRRRSELRQRCLDLVGEESLVFAEGYDAALIGIGWREGIPIAVYDRQGVIAILCRHDGMSPEDADEFFEFNVGVLLLLDRAGICCSAGSACTAGSIHPSHVLRAMGFSTERARGSLRFSFSRFNTEQEVDKALYELTKAVEKLRTATVEV